MMDSIKKPVEPPKPKDPKQSPSKTPTVTKAGSYRIVGPSSVVCSNGHTHGSIVAAVACGKN